MNSVQLTRQSPCLAFRLYVDAIIMTCNALRTDCFNHRGAARTVAAPVHDAEDPVAAGEAVDEAARHGAGGHAPPPRPHAHRRPQQHRILHHACFE